MTNPSEDEDGTEDPEPTRWAYRRILEPHHDALRDLQSNLHAPHESSLPHPIESELEASLGDAVEALEDALTTLHDHGESQ